MGEECLSYINNKSSEVSYLDEEQFLLGLFANLLKWRVWVFWLLGGFPSYPTTPEICPGPHSLCLLFLWLKSKGSFSPLRDPYFQKAEWIRVVLALTGGNAASPWLGAILEPVRRPWGHQPQQSHPPRTGLRDPDRPLAPPLALPAPGVVPVTGKRSQLVVGKGILQVAVVGVVEHGLDSLPGVRYEK